jgi:hypothetical protein
MAIIVGVVIAVVLVAAVAVTVWVRGRMLLPSDRRRLGVLASELHARARMDAMTRATAQAMRDTVRRYQ